MSIKSFKLFSILLIALVLNITPSMAFEIEATTNSYNHDEAMNIENNALTNNIDPKNEAIESKNISMGNSSKIKDRTETHLHKPFIGFTITTSVILLGSILFYFVAPRYMDIEREPYIYTNRILWGITVLSFIVTISLGSALFDAIRKDKGTWS